MTGKLVGYWNRQYTDKATGEVKRTRGVYMVMDKTEEKEGLTGYEVKEIPAYFDVTRLKIGQGYRLDYDIRYYGTTVSAKLVGMTATTEKESA